MKKIVDRFVLCRDAKLQGEVLVRSMAAYKVSLTIIEEAASRLQSAVSDETAAELDRVLGLAMELHLLLNQKDAESFGQRVERVRESLGGNVPMSFLKRLRESQQHSIPDGTKERMRRRLEIRMEEERIARRTCSISSDGKSITCLKCRRTSHNLNDVRELYCGFCHFFHERREK